MLHLGRLGISIFDQVPDPERMTVGTTFQTALLHRERTALHEEQALI